MLGFSWRRVDLRIDHNYRSCCFALYFLSMTLCHRTVPSHRIGKLSCFLVKKMELDPVTRCNDTQRSSRIVLWVEVNPTQCLVGICMHSHPPPSLPVPDPESSEDSMTAIHPTTSCHVMSCRLRNTFIQEQQGSLGTLPI